MWTFTNYMIVVAGKGTAALDNRDSKVQLLARVRALQIIRYSPP